MRKLLWIGSYVDVETENFLKEHINYKKPSTSLSQRNILEGIEQIVGREMDCLGAVSMHGYPNDKRIWVPSVLQKRDNSTCHLVGFLNICYLNKIATTIALEDAAKKWTKQNKCDEGLDIFVYEARSACLQAAAIIKKKVPDTRIHLIVPDLPQYMDLHMSKVKHLLKQIDWMLIKRMLSNVDSFILYAKAMAEAMGIQDRPCVTMEGSVQISQDTAGHLPKYADEEKCIVLYSGNLDSRFGILNLISAMDLLGDSTELWLTGMGADAKTVEYAAKNRKNVKYFGFLKDQFEVMRMQSKATALINMRDPNEEASKYCFPSKIFEYMLSGKPVLSCKLGGIPEEYFEHLIPMESIQPQDIAQAIRKLAEMSPEERNLIGQKGRQFIQEQKNNIAQAERIVKFTLNNF